MSSFTKPLRGEWNDDMDKFTLTEEFEYYTGTKDVPGDTIIVPAGFVTDFASVPKFLHWLMHPTGRHGKAAVIHDYMYKMKLYNRATCDNIFYDAMVVLNVSKVKALAMYKAVRLFGEKYYNGK